MRDSAGLELRDVVSTLLFLPTFFGVQGMWEISALCLITLIIFCFTAKAQEYKKKIAGFYLVVAGINVVGLACSLLAAYDSGFRPWLAVILMLLAAVFFLSPVYKKMKVTDGEIHST